MSDDAHDEKSNKQSGAQNALKHGAFAKVFILPDEDQQAFRELRRSFRQDLKPDGALETLYFTGVVQSAWTVIRVCRWIQRCHTLAEATYVRSAETDDDQGGKLTLIEQVAHQTATVSALWNLESRQKSSDRAKNRQKNPMDIKTMKMALPVFML